LNYGTLSETAIILMDQLHRMHRRVSADAAAGALKIAATGVYLLTLTLALVTAGAVNSAATPKGEVAAQGSDCFSCHAADHKVVGPPFDAVAAKFAGQPGAAATLADAVKKGHVGTWGDVPMPPHPKLSDAQINEMISWVLSLKPQSNSTAPTASKSYSYNINGKAVTTHVQIFQPDSDKVTADVFRGYELYDSYCFRCHGEDALGSLYAPDLRRSLDQGMTEQQFLSTAMAGVKAKGMPSWAGFLAPHDVQAIYAYVKARAIGAIPTGVPKE
jgi:cytochrome c